MRPSLLLLPLVALLSSATHLVLSIVPTAQLPSLSSLPSSTIATLTTLSQSHTAHLSASSTFSFRNVSSASYLFDVHCPTHFFPPLRIDVAQDGTVAAWGTFRGNDWNNKGEVVPVREGDGRRMVIEIKAGRAKEYFMERSGFSPLSILKNPMILIGIASMGLVFGLPKLMENMDPEMRAELEERQKTSSVSGLLAGGQANTNPLGNFDAAAWLAGSGKKEAVDVSGTGQGKGVRR